MRALALVVLAHVALVLAACSRAELREPAGTRASESLVAMSFNVRYGSADDGPDAWPLRRDDLLTRIREQAPTLLGVQEALDFQIEWLERELPGHVRVGQGREGGARGEHCALFLERARLEVLASGDFWLSERPDEVGSVGWDAALPRICTWARVRERATGREFTAWNAHFDHRGEVARERSGQLLASRILAFRGEHVVLGDFNCGETSPALRALAAAGLRDTFRDVPHGTGDVGTFHAFRGGSAGEKIDFVLATQGLRTVSAAILAEPGARGRWPSDHHAVVAALAWSE